MNTKASQAGVVLRLVKGCGYPFNVENVGVRYPCDVVEMFTEGETVYLHRRIWTTRVDPRR